MIVDSLTNQVLHQIDTVYVMDAGKVAAFYADMMEKQSNQFGTLMTVIVAVFTVLLGVSWWWNYLGMQKQVRTEVDTAKNVIKDQVGTWEQQVKQELESFSTEKAKETSDMFRKEMKAHEADLDRLYGSSCLEGKNYIAGAEWLLTAFGLYMEMNKGHAMEVCLKAAINALKEGLDSETLDEDSLERIDGIAQRCEMIPDIYHSKKAEAKSLLKQYRKKYEEGLRDS